VSPGGTDRPHPLVTQPPWQNDAAMLDRLALWAPDPAVRRRILVDNPTRLYWAAQRRPSRHWSST